MNVPSTLSYKELGKLISEMPAERLDDSVTVLILGEAIPVGEFGPASVVDKQGDVSGVLDDGHFILKLG
jgi:hypothetical protein